MLVSHLLLRLLCFLVFVIDGPGLEYTHPAVMPWLVDRLAISLTHSDTFARQIA